VATRLGPNQWENAALCFVTHEALGNAVIQI